MPDLSPGSEFAGHRIDGVAGRGGMGVVYRAVHVALKRTVALKVLAAELAGTPDFRRRFREESEIAASLDHPNVIPIYDGGEDDGLLWVTMRFVEGTDLRELAAGAPLEPGRAADIVAQAAEALDAAHARGLVHRDVKPGNVLIEERAGRDHVFLTDFGLTKQVSSDPGTTETGNWLGTVDFAAPEQIRAKPIDGRADVYALGGVLYWALSGRVPYPRDNDLAKMYAHLNDPPPPLGAGAPRELEAVVRRAMAKDAADRYPSAGDLGRAALAAAAGREPAGPEHAVAAGAGDATAAVPESGGAGEPTAADSEPADPGSADPAAADPEGEPTRPLPVAPAPPSAIRAPGTRVLPVPPPRAAADRGSPPPSRRDPSRPAGSRARRNRIAAAVALGVGVILAALAVAGGLSGGGGSKVRTSGVPAAAARTPTNAEVRRLLQAYADAYHSEDAAGIGALLAPDAVRRNGGGPPETRAQAIAAYERQFAQLAGPTYRLSGLRMSTRPGAATVTGRYAITSASGTTTGAVAFGLVERRGRLAIRRLEISPD